MTAFQPDMFAFDPATIRSEVMHFLSGRLKRPGRPSARELLHEVRRVIGFRGGWYFEDCIRLCAQDTRLTGRDRTYFASMLEDDSITAALRGAGAATEGVVSSIDALLRQSKVYRSSPEFHEFIDFMGRFRQYSPYNNMLVRIQDPGCSFFATAKDWHGRFGRTLVEDARPLIILAPRHPVLLVYDVGQTTGPALPDGFQKFARFTGDWETSWMENLLENARRHRIRVDFRPLSSTHAGFARAFPVEPPWKIRIVVHAGLDERSRFGVLAHELAHVFLGHLGSDHDQWWPSRTNLGRPIMEIEAESVAHIVAARFGMSGDSASYIAGYLRDGAVPQAVSIDNIGKVASRIEQMAQSRQPAPRPRPPVRAGKDGRA